MVGPLQNFGFFTDQSFADPDDSEFVATVISNQSFTDVLTSGADPSDGLAAFGVPGDAGIGVVGETVNTFIDPSDPALESMLSFSLPFTDPWPNCLLSFCHLASDLTGRLIGPGEGVSLSFL